MTQSEPGSPEQLPMAIESGPPETTGQAVGRIVGGLALLLLGVVIMVACAAAFVASILMPSLWEWSELIGDGAWFVGAIALGFVIIGFTLLRSGRRRRAEAMTAAVSVFEETSADPAPHSESPNRIAPEHGIDPATPPKRLI